MSLAARCDHGVHALFTSPFKPLDEPRPVIYTTATSCVCINLQRACSLVVASFDRDQPAITMPLLSGARGGRSRRSGDGFLLPPVVADVGCNCRAPRVLSSLYSSLASRVRGGGSGSIRPKSSHASSSSTATAFTSRSTAGHNTATTVSSVDDAWGPATYATNTLYEDDVAAVEARGQRPRRRRSTRRRHRSRGGRGVGVGMVMARGEEEAAVAVEVVSAAPYEDFRESMVAMVVEKEMYAWEDLNALLHGFLSLNSPRHHPLILHAFADLWAPRGGLFCPPSPCLDL